MSDSSGSAWVIRLTPKIGLVRTGLVSILLVAIPVFGVLIWLGSANGTWPIALFGVIASLVLCVIAYVLFRFTFIGVTTTTIEERGYWGTRTSSPISDVHSVVLAQIYTSSSPETVPQLIVRNQQGERILRMRGNFWTIEAMQAAVQAIDVVAHIPHEAMTSSQFFEEYRGAAYWHERRPVLAITAVVVGAIVIAALVLGVLYLSGVKIIGG